MDKEGYKINQCSCKIKIISIQNMIISRF